MRAPWTSPSCSHAFWSLLVRICNSSWEWWQQCAQTTFVTMILNTVLMNLDQIPAFWQQALWPLAARPCFQSETPRPGITPKPGNTQGVTTSVRRRRKMLFCDKTCAGQFGAASWAAITENGEPAQIFLKTLHNANAPIWKLPIQHHLSKNSHHQWLDCGLHAHCNSF